ncbi:hypothetical protein [Wenjunlia vitaminophila]|uniref:hypothetical protein n=1 Tax=Wenjunlia vitaminophila TaxID=76728 RepID=UPI00035CC2B3|nr:hypothetical protein [Wenjunlia vitaminophila]
MAIPGNFLSPTTETIDPNTSGWTSLLNCTISRGTGGRSGDGTLRLTSVAAGEMRARTVASYPVVVGELYWTFADASSATLPERIGIRWLNAVGVEIGITWSLTTASASASWHRVSVAGIAPADTASAQVVLSSMTPAAPGVVHAFENVYLGWPLRSTGNLLSFNAESGGELDLSAWAAGTNCTLSRVAPASVWPATWYYAGGEQVALTVTAAGNADAECVERPAVTAGVDYAGFAYLSPPGAGSSTWVELRFFDGAGVLLLAKRSVLAAPGTGTYRQIASGVAPPGAATAGLAVGITGGTAGQVVRTEGAYVGTVAVATANLGRTGNVLTHEDWNFEQGVGQWAVVSGPAAIARSTPWGAVARYDSYSLAVSSPTIGASVLHSGTYAVPANAGGQSWRIAVVAQVGAGGWQILLNVHWWDGSGADLGVTAGTPGTMPTPGWWSVSEDLTAPEGAAEARVEITLTATSAASAINLDRAALWPMLPLTSVTARPDSASVQVILRELTVGETLTLWRVAGGQRTLVRGPDGLTDHMLIPSDTIVIEDYEAPLGVPLTYVTELWNVDGSAGGSRTSVPPVTLEPGDANTTWLKDPSRPQLNMRLLIRQAPDWQQPVEQSVLRVRGRPNAVIVSDVRGGREGDLVLWTQSDSERDALRYLLASSDVLLWQSHPRMGEPDVYVSVGQTTAARVTTYAPEPWREWTLPLVEQDQPTGGQSGSAVWTVQDVLVENDTVQTVLDRYATVMDLLLHQRTT